jgi:hypothetical protein
MNDGTREHGFWVQPMDDSKVPPLQKMQSFRNHVTPFTSPPLSNEPEWICTPTSHVDAANLMAFGRRKLRCVEWADIDIALFAASPRDLDAEAKKQRQEEIYALSRPLGATETKIDFFV